MPKEKTVQKVSCLNCLYCNSIGLEGVDCLALKSNVDRKTIDKEGCEKFKREF